MLLIDKTSKFYTAYLFDNYAYIMESEKDSEKSKIYRIKTDGTDSTLLYDNCDISMYRGTFMVNKDSKTKLLLPNGEIIDYYNNGDIIINFVIAKEGIFYLSNEFKLYKTNINGMQRELIANYSDGFK